mmetsp:Transcript_106183/g.310383  ORF Transcript_106183/g.310383 Transcript_106183/m.310383 type:complete len:300 (-) Transcript_106183:1303-2202(-)
MYRRQRRPYHRVPLQTLLGDRTAFWLQPGLSVGEGLPATVVESASDGAAYRCELHGLAALRAVAALSVQPGGICILLVWRQLDGVRPYEGHAAHIGLQGFLSGVEAAGDLAIALCYLRGHRCGLHGHLELHERGAPGDGYELSRAIGEWPHVSGARGPGHRGLLQARPLPRAHQRALPQRLRPHGRLQGHPELRIPRLCHVHARVCQGHTVQAGGTVVKGRAPDAGLLHVREARGLPAHAPRGGQLGRLAHEQPHGALGLACDLLSALPEVNRARASAHRLGAHCRPDGGVPHIHRPAL